MSHNLPSKSCESVFVVLYSVIETVIFISLFPSLSSLSLTHFISSQSHFSVYVIADLCSLFSLSLTLLFGKKRQNVTSSGQFTFLLTADERERESVSL